MFAPKHMSNEVHFKSLLLTSALPAMMIACVKHKALMQGTDAMSDGLCSLQQTVRQLKLESQPLAHSMTLPAHKAASGAASDLMFYVAAEGKPSNYSKSFEFLLDWVDISLDMYKASPSRKTINWRFYFIESHAHCFSTLTWAYNRARLYPSVKHVGIAILQSSAALT